MPRSITDPRGRAYNALAKTRRSLIESRMSERTDVELTARKADHFLDISDDVCPMTFVRTRLLIEKMAAGEVAEIRLPGGEPLENVPDSILELGHKLLRIEEEPGAPAPGIHRLWMQKL